MDKNQMLRQRIQAASGTKKAELVLKNASIVNVFTCELETADIAIEGGYIAGIGQYEGEREVDLRGKTVCPGFIDGHIHLESSWFLPQIFSRRLCLMVQRLLLRIPMKLPTWQVQQELNI